MVERQGARPIAVLVGLDRKSVQRYIAAAAEADLDRGTAERALDDELMAKGMRSGPAPPPTWARGALVSSSGSPRPVESVADRQWPDRSQG